MSPSTLSRGSAALIRVALVWLAGVAVAAQPPQPATWPSPRPATPPAAQPASAVDTQAKLQAAVTRVYDPAVLHNIDIVIAPQDVPAVERREDARVSCAAPVRHPVHLLSAKPGRRTGRQPIDFII